jgi:hypothetical protein
MCEHKAVISIGGAAVALCGAIVLGTCGICPATAADSNAEAAPAGQSAPGSWVAHDYHFFYMNFTSTYSCNGLIDKLGLLLKASGAQVTRIEPECARPYGEPDRLAQVDVKFSTLMPVANGSGASPSGSEGVWRHVALTQRTLNDSLASECGLVEQFRNVLLPMFATQNVKSDLHCVPNEVFGPFSLSFDVFEPGGGAPSATGSAASGAQGSEELYAYPKNGQSPEQQASDRSQCRAFASSQAAGTPVGAGQHQEYLRAEAACLEARGYTVE